MGHEKWYVALPENSELLTRAETSPEFGEYLGFPSIFASGGEWWRSGDIDEPGKDFCAQVQALNEAHPGLKDRVFTLDRSYDKLHYLLSEARQRGEFDYNDWTTQAILGAKSLPEHLQGGQGHPIRYTPPDVIQDIAFWLEFITPVRLLEAYNPVAMAEQGVYKISPNDDATTLGYICDYFDKWKAFYREVAQHAEGVLVITT